MEKIPNQGLSAREVQKLQHQYGLNDIPTVKQFTLIKSFLGQFNNFLTILLIIAGCISLALGERIDSLFIFLIVLLNALFGVFQEFKAEKALKTLKQMSSTRVRVIRDGKEQDIDSRELVPGDIIYIEEGSKIPADAKIISSLHLQVNEASLTGESIPVEKHAHEENKQLLFMGTVVAGGR